MDDILTIDDIRNHLANIVIQRGEGWWGELSSAEAAYLFDELTTAGFDVEMHEYKEVWEVSVRWEREYYGELDIPEDE